MGPTLTEKTFRSRERRGPDGRKGPALADPYAIVEFALAAFALMAMTLGAVDMGRAFYDGIAVVHAGVGSSFFGAQRVAFTGRDTEMEALAEEDAAEIKRGESLTVSTDRFCDCPGNPADGPSDPNAVDCINGICAGYGQPRVYVRTRVQQNFRTLGPWPGVPDPVDINQALYFRAQ